MEVREGRGRGGTSVCDYLRCYPLLPGPLLLSIAEYLRPLCTPSPLPPWSLADSSIFCMTGDWTWSRIPPPLKAAHKNIIKLGAGWAGPGQGRQSLTRPLLGSAGLIHKQYNYSYSATRLDINHSAWVVAGQWWLFSTSPVQYASLLDPVTVDLDYSQSTIYTTQISECFC